MQHAGTQVSTIEPPLCPTWQPAHAHTTSHTSAAGPVGRHRNHRTGPYALVPFINQVCIAGRHHVCGTHPQAICATSGKRSVLCICHAMSHVRPAGPASLLHALSVIEALRGARNVQAIAWST